MGVDLMLLPLSASDKRSNSEFCSWSLLDLERRHTLWAEIRKLPCETLLSPLRTPLGTLPKSNEEGSRKLEEDELNPEEYWDWRIMTADSYDVPLCRVDVNRLLSLRNHEGVQDNSTNRAAWAYLAELPNDTEIVLYWY